MPFVDADPKIVKVVGSTVQVGSQLLTCLSHPVGVERSVPDVAVNRTGSARTLHIAGLVRDAAAFDVTVDPATFEASELTDLLGTEVSFVASCSVIIGGAEPVDKTLTVPCYVQAVKPSDQVAGTAESRVVTWVLTLQPTNAVA